MTAKFYIESNDQKTRESINTCFEANKHFFESRKIDLETFKDHVILKFCSNSEKLEKKKREVVLSPIFNFNEINKEMTGFSIQCEKDDQPENVFSPCQTISETFLYAIKIPLLVDITDPMNKLIDGLTDLGLWQPNSNTSRSHKKFENSSFYGDYVVSILSYPNDTNTVLLYLKVRELELKSSLNDCKDRSFDEIVRPLVIEFFTTIKTLNDKVILPDETNNDSIDNQLIKVHSSQSNICYLQGEMFRVYVGWYSNFPKKCAIIHNFAENKFFLYSDTLVDCKNKKNVSYATLWDISCSAEDFLNMGVSHLFDMPQNEIIPSDFISENHVTYFLPYKNTCNINIEDAFRESIVKLSNITILPVEILSKTKTELFVIKIISVLPVSKIIHPSHKHFPYFLSVCKFASTKIYLPVNELSVIIMFLQKIKPEKNADFNFNTVTLENKVFLVFDTDLF
jgi:hypothetical protein